MSRRVKRRCGALLLDLFIMMAIVTVVGALALTAGERYQHISQTIKMESAAVELMQDLYRVQTKNYGCSVETPLLHIDSDADEYSICAGSEPLYSKRFPSVRFHASPMNFLFNQDGSPCKGGTIAVTTDDGALQYTITVLPVTGRIAVKRS